MARINRREAVFLGVTASDARVFARNVFKELVATHPVVHLPAVGHFLLAKSALQAGYEPGNIRTSDISLYTGLLGNLLDPTSPPIPYTLSDELEEGYTAVIRSGWEDTPRTRVAYVLWWMKKIQFTKDSYMSPFLEDMDVNREKHLQRVAGRLDDNVAALQGINYRHLDLRAVVTAEYGADELVVVNPPIVANGYEKMYDFGEQIVFDPDVPEFAWSKEYRPLYDQSKESPAPFLWSRYYTAEGFEQREVVYAKENRADKVDYWLCTKPGLLDGMGKTLKTYTRKNFHQAKMPLWGLGDKMTKDSVIQFVNAPVEQVLYYRDIFAHRLGASGGDANLLMLVDGKVFGTVLLQGEDVRSLRGEYICLNSGFTTASNVYQRPNRLLNWCITSGQFADVFRTTIGKNRFYIATGMKTTVFSKYRKTKANNGIWTIRDRERQKNGTYKIVYLADFRKGETFKDALNKFLDEEEANNGA